eukprot:TRINITY_DN25115_c0_g1_i1.p1 TRINITY_DN25115_c0_g1~~TRINITY_DN25115_c0_g1_i1.p1  ORF type:complete len:219 (-),score=7.97 TRINITY_DN25115_c0_g1_i1:38-694(-)
MRHDQYRQPNQPGELRQIAQVKPPYTCQFPCCCCQISARDSVKMILIVDGVFLAIEIIFGLANRQWGVLILLLYFALICTTFYYVRRKEPTCIRLLSVIARYIIYSISTILGILFLILGILVLVDLNQKEKKGELDGLSAVIGLLLVVSGSLLLLVGLFHLLISRIYQLAMNACNKQDEMVQRPSEVQPQRRQYDEIPGGASMTKSCLLYTSPSPRDS